MTFEVEVTSPTHPSYQWTQNGVDIAGATSSSYTIVSLQPTDEADYSVRISNVGGSATSANATLTVLVFNAAPVLDDSRSPVVAPVNQGAGAPVGAVGTLVSALVDFVSPAGQLDNVADPDAGTLLGIAVTGADTAHGAWFYSINNGTTWNALGTVSDAGARLLAADADTRVYFQPHANYSGTLANAITFRAWDQTSGGNGGTSVITSTNTVLDNFSTESWANNDGNQSWSTDWIEMESGGAGAGKGNLQVKNDQLLINASVIGDNIYREANLSGATSATLSYGYDSTSFNNNPEVLLQISSDGGGSYTTLKTYTAANAVVGTESIPITSHISDNTRIRFYVSGRASTSRAIFIDDFQIQYSRSSGGTSAFSTTTDTANLVVNAPPTLSASGSAAMTPEGFSFAVSVPVGATYVIEASSNHMDWTPLATNVADSVNITFTDPSAANFPSRFYRALLQ